MIAIDISQPKLSDFKDISYVESACFPKSEGASAKSFIERLLSFPESFLVAKAGAKIIGFVNGAVTNSEVIYDDMFHGTSHHNPNGCYQSIFGLAVLPEFRKQGIASRLLKEFIFLTKNRGKKGLILTCKEPLINFYKLFGFSDLGISKSTHGGAVWYDMILKFSTATNLKILEAESKDFQEILALQRLAFYENAVLYNDFNITPLTQTIEDIANESKTHTILKAVSENKIIGTVRGGIIGDYCHLSKLSVHPNFQNQGIGQRLILAIESNFKGATFRIVTGYKDEKNIALYQKLGYKIYKNERIENNPCSVFMEKVGNNSEF